MLLQGEHFRTTVILMSALEINWGVIGIGINIDWSLFFEHGWVGSLIIVATYWGRGYLEFAVIDPHLRNFPMTLTKVEEQIFSFHCCTEVLSNSITNL